MAETSKTTTPEMRYLLGALSKEEATRLEETFFADDSKFEELELAEDELIDAFVRRELTDDERQRFNKKLRTSPRLVERLHFAQVLAERASDLFPPEHDPSRQEIFSGSEPTSKTMVGWWERHFGSEPKLRVAFAACVILLLISGVVSVAGWLRLRSESERINSERQALIQQKGILDKELSDERTRTEQLTVDLQHERNQRTQDQELIEKLQRGQKRDEGGQPSFVGTVASLFLTPGSLRSGGGSRQLIVAARTGTVELRLALESNDYRSYDVSVKNANGADMFSQKGLKPRNTRSGQVLTLSVPSDRLPPDDYIVSVHGLTSSRQLESLSDYAFRVTKK